MSNFYPRKDIRGDNPRIFSQFPQNSRMGVEGGILVLFFGGGGRVKRKKSGVRFGRKTMQK